MATPDASSPVWRVGPMAANERLTNLMFLLGLAPLAAGCPGDDGGGDTGLTTASTMTTMGGTTNVSGDGTGDDGTGPGDASASASAEDGPEPTTSSMDDTAGDDAPGATDDGGSDTGTIDCSEPPPTPMGPISAACQGYTAKFDECYGLTMECLVYYDAYCQYTLEAAAMYGAACGMATEELLTCLSSLTCEQFAAETGCDAEVMAQQTACMAASGVGPRLLRRR